MDIALSVFALAWVWVETLRFDAMTQLNRVDRPQVQ